MPYTITTKDGITVRNIPDSIPPDSIELKARVERIRRGEPQEQSSAVAQIPGGGAPSAPAQEPGILDRIAGAGEAGLTVGTGTLGYLAGLVSGGNEAIKALLYGATGTQPAPGQMPDPSGVAERTQQAVLIPPKTEAGRDALRAIEQAGQFFAPLAGMSGQVAQLSQAARAARTAAPAATAARAAVEGVARDVAGPVGASAAAGAIDAAQAAGKAIQRTATTLPRKAWESIAGSEKAATKGTKASVGAAGTDAATQRTALAGEFGLTGEAALTKGQASRDAAQLNFEIETAKRPDVGGDLRERRNIQNARMIEAIERDIDNTGATATSWRQLGEIVADKTVLNQYRIDKSKNDAQWTAARKSPEASATVDPGKLVTIGEGENAVTTNAIRYINDQPAGLETTTIPDAARQLAVSLGIAEKGPDGKLIPRTATIQQMEDWRREINQNRGSSPSDKRHLVRIKALIDAQTEPVAGPLFRQARAGRARLAQNYEDRATVAKLMATKPRSTERAVALEDVFDHVVIKSSNDELKNFRRVMFRSEGGPQAWGELRGGTMQWLKREAGLDTFGGRKRIATDASSNAVLNVQGLNRAVFQLDADGKLETIFGKLGAQRIRDLNDIAQVIKTIPPEAGINQSGTAAALATAFADIAGSVATGIPAPLATAARLGLKYSKDKKLRARVDDALAGYSSQTTP